MFRHARFSAPLLLLLTLTTAAEAQSVLAKFHGEDSHDLAGGRVAIEGDRALIGAIHAHGSTASGDGACYLLRKTAGAWPMTVLDAGVTELFPVASIYNETFGAAVAMHGPILAVGQPELNTSLTIADHGGVSVFFDDGITVVREADLVPTLTVDALAGSALSVHDDLVAIGAPGAFGSTTDPGTVFLYRRATALPHWGAPEATLTAAGGLVGDRFGYAVVVHGDICLVGAPNRDGVGVDSGAVYAFVRDALGNWTADGELVPSVPAAGAYHGGSIDFDGTTAIVGAQGQDSAYLFRRLGPANWVEVARLEGIDATRDESFGYGVAIEGDRAAVTALRDDVVHVFRRRAPGDWLRAQRLNELYTNGMGSAVDLSGTAILVGAPLDGDAGPNSGAAFFFEAPTYVDQAGFGDAGACPCANDFAYGGCQNSTGTGGVLRVEGTNSVAADDLELHATRLPGGKPCVLLIGDGLSAAPLGSGLRIVALGTEGFARINAGLSTLGGQLTLGPNMGAVHPKFANFVSPGERWNFQVWHRDAAHGACTLHQNLTNAVSVTFVP